MLIGQLVWEKTDLTRGLKTFDGYATRNNESAGTINIIIPFSIPKITDNELILSIKVTF